MHLKFATLVPDIDTAFWASAAAFKLDEDGNERQARHFKGFYSLPRSGQDQPCTIHVRETALQVDVMFRDQLHTHGTLMMENTMEDFEGADRRALLQAAGMKIWADFENARIYDDPSILSSMIIVCYADLKAHRFRYECGFPAFQSTPRWVLLEDPEGFSSRLFVHKQCDALPRAYRSFCSSVPECQRGFFLARRIHSPREKCNGSGLDAEEWVLGSLGSFHSGFFSGVPQEDRFIAFADPSTSLYHPAWMLRNFLALVQSFWQMTEVRVLCFRAWHSDHGSINTLRFHIRCAEQETNHNPQQSGGPMPRVSGWEKTQDLRPCRREINLQAHMSADYIAGQAVDLNLKLIKWRLAPSLDLEVIKRTRCLILGAGTLGTYVARTLQGWGVRNITFVDSARVSYSNPVRQCLFLHEDCRGGGAEKAVRAAQTLRDISPVTEAQGFVFEIPMIGHTPPDLQKAEHDFKRLRELIEENDAIFLLMDSRESRWLPTVMGRSCNKLVMNAALGFDSFLAMHHGFGARPISDDFGCYFCSDVVAPSNSIANRTLDQKCTTSRPGLAPLASALLVEIFVSVLQCSRNIYEPDRKGGKGSADTVSLGLVPHQIRGFLRDFRQMVLTVPRSSHCSACSRSVLDAYEKSGWAFVLKAITEVGLLEEISGLREVHRQAECAMATMNESDNEF